MLVGDDFHLLVADFGLSRSVADDSIYSHDANQQHGVSQEETAPRLVTSWTIQWICAYTCACAMCMPSPHPINPLVTTLLLIVLSHLFPC